MQPFQDAHDFELALRTTIDQKFDRPSPQNNPILRLLEDDLPLEELRAFYRGLWETLMVFNRVLLARLMEKAPTHPIRCEVVEVILPEFGKNLRDAHPIHFKNFLEAIGVPRRELSWDFSLDEGSGSWVDEVKMIRNLSWAGLLGRIIPGESIGPVTFEAVAEACRRNYRLPDHALAYFMIHASHDKKDTEVLFRLARETITDPAGRAELMSTVNASFDSGRYVLYGCRLPDTAAYRYAPLQHRRSA